MEARRILETLDFIGGRWQASNISWGMKGAEDTVFELLAKKYQAVKLYRNEFKSLSDLLNYSDIGIIKNIRIPVSDEITKKLGRTRKSLQIDFILITKDLIQLIDNKSYGISNDEAPSGTFQKFDEMIKSAQELCPNKKVSLIILRNSERDYENHGHVQYFKNNGVETFLTAQFLGMTYQEFQKFTDPLRLDTVKNMFKQYYINDNTCDMIKINDTKIIFCEFMESIASSITEELKIKQLNEYTKKLK